MRQLIKSRKFYLWTLLPGCLFIGSCETTVDIDIPFEKPQVTLNAELVDNTSPEVRLTYSRHILDDNWEFEPVTQAEVKLIMENETYSLSYDTENQVYSNLDYLIEGGKEYRVEVLLAGYDIVSASEKVPDQVPVKQLIYNGTAQSDIWSSSDDITLVFDDPAGDNFYEISAYYFREDYYIDQDGNQIWYTENYPIYLAPKNPTYENDFNTNGAVLIDDKLFEGKEANIDFFTEGIYLGQENGGEIHFVLKAVSSSYYLFRSTYGLQDWNDGDPFAQPVQVYSNIENGIGILMTGNISSKKMEN
jgi:hypothetical protein